MPCRSFNDSQFFTVMGAQQSQYIVPTESFLIVRPTLNASTAWSVTVPNLGQSTTTISVPGVITGSHWARANMSVTLGGVQMSAYVSAADTVTVVAQNNQSSSVGLNGTLFVEAGWL